MKDQSKTKQALIQELASLRHRIAELERSEEERKRAEEELRKSEREIHDLYDNSPCGYHSLDKDGLIIRINNTELNWLGYSRDEVIGKMKLSDLLTSKSAEDFKKNFALFKERGWTQDLEYELVRKDGTILPVLLSATAVKDIDGNYLMSRSILYDITQQKKMEEVLQESEERFRALADAAWEGIVIHRKGVIMDANEAALKMIGYPPEEVIGQIVLMFLAPESIEPALQRLKESIDTPQLYLEAKGLRKDKTVFPIEVLGRPIRYKNLDARVLAIRDLTERKQAEEGMRAVNRKLRAMASEMVRTEERERQHLAAVLHDTVAQTLAAIKLKCVSIQDHLSSDGLETMKEAQNLITESIRQTRMILVELSPPVLYEIGFIPALEYLTEQVSDQHGIPITFDCLHDIQWLSHDVEILLYQATRELLINVVKHSKATSAEVKVSGKARKIQITVSDNGIGMDTDHIGYREDLGGGFGLFSIRERMKHFGGYLNIQSRPGNGTIITMTMNEETEKVTF